MGINPKNFMDCLPLPNFGSHRLLLRGYLTHLLDSSLDVILWNDSYRVVMPPQVFGMDQLLFHTSLERLPTSMFPEEPTRSQCTCITGISDLLKIFQIARSPINHGADYLLPGALRFGEIRGRSIESVRLNLCHGLTFKASSIKEVACRKISGARMTSRITATESTPKSKRGRTFFVVIPPMAINGLVTLFLMA